MSRGPLCGATNPLHSPTPGSWGHNDEGDPSSPVLIKKTPHPQGTKHVQVGQTFDFAHYDPAVLAELGLVGQLVYEVLGVKYGQPYGNALTLSKEGKLSWNGLGAKFNATTGVLARDDAGDEVLRCVAFVDYVLSQYLRGSITESQKSYSFEGGRNIFTAYDGKDVGEFKQGKFSDFSQNLQKTHLYGIQYPGHVVLLTYSAIKAKWITLQSSGYCDDTTAACYGPGVSIIDVGSKGGHVYDFGERKPSDSLLKSPPLTEFELELTPSG